MLRRLPHTLAAPLILALGSLAACGDGNATVEEPAASAEAKTSPGDGPPASSPGEPVRGAPLTGEAALAALHANVAATAARPEHTDAVVELAHILVAFEGADPRIKIKGRTREQAEQRAADLLARVQAGEDFEAVRVPNTDDPGSSTYKLSNNNTQGTSKRRSMVKGFGDVGWRLAVGEVGVAPHDPAASPFGWHIIKRVK